MEVKGDIEDGIIINYRHLCETCQQREGLLRGAVVQHAHMQGNARGQQV